MSIAVQPEHKRGVQPVQAVTKALRILELMADEGGPRSLSELTLKLGLSSSTVYRLLMTLCRSGFVEHDEGGLYRLGLKAFHIGHSALTATDVSREARPFMEQLSQSCRETANLVVLRGRDAIFVEQVEAQQMMLRCHLQVGSRIPAHASGGGKALLAELSDAKVDALFGRVTLESFTPYTLSGLPDLLRALAEIRARGYAVDDQEREIGVRCVAAAIRNYAGDAVAAVTLTGPAERLSHERIETELGRRVRQTAALVSKALGRASTAII
ncbi:MAG TPA: IclR family transcriptional regulator [Limnochordia bacterium]|nr:IclR family transcriptional regulator [Limnochordia bacterium]